MPLPSPAVTDGDGGQGATLVRRPQRQGARATGGRSFG